MGKYKSQIFKYLVEILVIIFGIVGAFALDSWNQNRNNKILEQKVIQQIKEDLIVVLQDLKNDFIVHEIALKSHFRLDSVIKNRVTYADKMTFDFYWIKEDEYIFPNRTGYQTLESFGTNLLSNQELKSYISYVYNHDFPRITKGNNLYPDINEFLTPYYQQNFKTNVNPDLKYTLILAENYKITYPREIKLGKDVDLEFIGFTPLDFKKTVNDNEFQYLLSESKKYRIYKYKMYKNTVEHVEELIKLIDKFAKGS